MEGRVIVGGVADAATRLRTGLALEAAGRLALALEIYRGIAEQGGDPETMYDVGCRLLLHGDYANGWRAYEKRQPHIDKGIRGRPRLSFPEWDGRVVRSLLVLPEQGVGDKIMFARYVPLLVERGIEVTLLCHPSAARLFSGLGAHVLIARGGVAVPAHDAWALLPSLPYRFGTRLDSIPRPLPIGGTLGGRGVGVAWRGNPDHANDANRSLPPTLGAELLRLPGAVSLHPEDTGAADFEDTRQIISGLERVISVDTSVAHLAASMGKPTTILLPYDPDWRWMRGRSDSPWYPSATLIRQPAVGDWRSVLDQLKPRSGTTR